MIGSRSSFRELNVIVSINPGLEIIRGGPGNEFPVSKLKSIENQLLFVGVGRVVWVGMRSHCSRTRAIAC